MPRPRRSPGFPCYPSPALPPPLCEFGLTPTIACPWPAARRIGDTPPDAGREFCQRWRRPLAGVILHELQAALEDGRRVVVERRDVIAVGTRAHRDLAVRQAGEQYAHAGRPDDMVDVAAEDEHRRGDVAQVRGCRLPQLRQRGSRPDRYPVVADLVRAWLLDVARDAGQRPQHVLERGG